MAERVLAIQVGENITRVAEVEAKNENMRAYHAFAFQTPEGTFDERGLIQNNPQFRNYLHKLLMDSDIHTTKAVFLISANKIGTKEESLPAMKDKQMTDFIRTNVKQFFPLEVDKYQVVHRINGDGKTGEKRVQMYAIPKDIIASYMAVSKFCGLELYDLELLENAVAEVMKKTRKSGVGANIDIEEDHSVLTIVKDGGIEFQRMIPYGFASVVEAVCDENIFGNNISFMETLSKMRSVDSFYEHLDDIGSGDSRIKDTATEEVKYLIGNLVRMIEYYSSQHQDTQIPYVTIEGLGSDNRGFMTLISNEFPVEVKRMASSESNVVKNLKEISSPSFYFVNAIAPFHPIGISISELNEGGKKVQTTKEAIRGFVIVFIVMAIVAVGLSAYPLVKKMIYTREIANYQTQIDSMSEAREVYNKYLATQTEYNKLSALDGYSVTAESVLPNVINELEANTPSGTTVTSIDATSTNVVIGFKSPDKDTAALTMQQMRNLSDLTVSTVDSLTAETGEGGIILDYTYNMTFTYKTEAEKEAEGIVSTDTNTDTTGTDTNTTDSTTVTDTSTTGTDANAATDASANSGSNGTATNGTDINGATNSNSTTNTTNTTGTNTTNTTGTNINSTTTNTNTTNTTGTTNSTNGGSN